MDSGTAGASLDELVGALSYPAVYHWRLRLRYHPATSPFQQHSRWFTVPSNGWQEADFRTLLQADLAVTQTEGADPVFFGGDLTWTVNLSSAGPDGAPVTTLRDTLPAGAAFVSAVPSQGTCGVPAGGVIMCALGLLAAGGGASVTVTVTPASPGSYTNTAEVSFQGRDPDATNNIVSETTTVLPLPLGDRVWEDRDGDGIQDAGEPGVVSALVYLLDATTGSILDFTFTDTNGRYQFQRLPGSYVMRFIPPTGFVFSPRDQGADDEADSDVDPATGRTASISPTAGFEATRWDAGVVPSVACVPPDEPIYLYLVTLSADGNDYPILHSQDGNQPTQITGYNIYRSSNPALPYAQWPLMASDVIDMDEATPNKQWVDTSGDVPPGGIWYYEVTAFNERCPAEGPF